MNPEINLRKAGHTILVVVNLSTIFMVLLTLTFQNALAETNSQRKILHIMSYHSPWKWTDDQGYSNQVEQYLSKHSTAQFSHGICPDCAAKIYPDIDIEEDGVG